jgi:hypothetical protein
MITFIGVFMHVLKGKTLKSSVWPLLQMFTIYGFKEIPGFIYGYRILIIFSMLLIKMKCGLD